MVSACTPYTQILLEAKGNFYSTQPETEGLRKLKMLSQVTESESSQVLYDVFESKLKAAIEKAKTEFNFPNSQS